MVMVTRTFSQDLEKELENEENLRALGEEAIKYDIGLVICRERCLLQLSRAELANITGMTESYIAKLESGERNPRIGTIGRLLAALNLRLSSFCIGFPPGVKRDI